MSLQKYKQTRTAVILCGGKGTRLGSITKKIPKTLVKINDKPIIWYILKTLKNNNFNHFILPIGYKGDQIKKYIQKENFNEFNIKIVSTGVNTPIAKRIFKIKKFISSENFLLLNGDAIFDFNINKIFLNHQNKNNDFTLISSEITYPYGTIGVKNNRVVDFRRNLVYEAVKVRNKNNYIAYNYTGMSIINTKKLLQNCKIFKNSSNFEIDLFPFFITKYKSNIVKSKGFWHSIDNVKDLIAINNKKLSIEKYIKLSKIKKKLNR